MKATQNSRLTRRVFAALLSLALTAQLCLGAVLAYAEDGVSGSPAPATGGQQAADGQQATPAASQPDGDPSDAGTLLAQPGEEASSAQPGAPDGALSTAPPPSPLSAAQNQDGVQPLGDEAARGLKPKAIYNTLGEIEVLDYTGIIILATTTWYGDGSAASFTLNNGEDLAGLAQLVNAGNTFAGKTLKLANSLLGATLPSIGTEAHPFNGTFDGNNKSLQNPTISFSGKSYVGLFGRTGPGSTIKDLSLAGGTLTVDEPSPTGAQIRYVGTIVGYGEGTVANCTSSMAVTITSKLQLITNANPGCVREVGGIAGYLKGDLLDCTYSGSLSITSPANILSDPQEMKYIVGNVGGLVGLHGDFDDLVASYRITGCKNTAPLNIETTGSGGTDRFGVQLLSVSACVGGIAGSSTGTIRGCQNSGGILTGAGTYGKAVATLEEPIAGRGAAECGGIVGNLRGKTFDVLATETGMGTATDSAYDYFKASGSTSLTPPPTVSILDCLNTATVVGLTTVGGIAGNTGSFTLIEGCGNTGDIKGCRWNKPFAAGIAGDSRSDIRYCYNRGGIWSVTGAGYLCAGIAGSFRTVNNPTTPDDQRVPGIEMTGCYTTGQVYTNAAGFRSGILAGESNGYLHANLYLANLTKDGKVVDEDDGTTDATNEVISATDLKASQGIAKLNSYAAGAGAWSVFYVADTANANEGFPVFDREITPDDTTGRVGITSVASLPTLLADAKYLGSSDPTPSVGVTPATLAQNADYRVIPQAGARALSTGGAYTATIVGMGRYFGTLATIRYDITKGDIGQCTIVAAPAVFNWHQQQPAWVKLMDATGNEVDPSEYEVVSLARGENDTTQVMGKFYDYKNSHGDSYKYDIKVNATATGSYTGSTTQAAFRIAFASVFDESRDDPSKAEGAKIDKVVWQDQEWDFVTAMEAVETGEGLIEITYTGSPIKPTVTGITYLGEPLRDGTGQPYAYHPYDYDFKYVYGNPNPEFGKDADDYSEMTDVSASSTKTCMTVRFTSGGNFKNYANVFFRIVPAGFDLVTAEGIASVPATGFEQKPDVSMKYNGKTLVKDKDYTLSYSDNINPGIAHITVTGKGNYSGTKNVDFTITQRAVDDPAFTAGVYTIRTINTFSPTKVLDIPGQSTVNGTKLNTWDDNRMAHQRFTFTKGADGYFTIRNLNSGKVLDVPESKAVSGVSVIQWAAGGTDNQKWALLENPDGSYTISPKLNLSLCLDIEGSSKSNGATVLLFTRNNTANQKFVFQKVEQAVANGTYTIDASYVGLVLDVHGGGKINGANVQLWTPHGQGSQKFELTYSAATGYYTIINPQSGMALDVTGASTVRGTNVEIWTPHGGKAQQWAIEPAGDGTYRLFAACSGLVLDATGSSKVSGTNVVTWTDSGTANQKWRFTAAS